MMTKTWGTRSLLAAACLGLVLVLGVVPAGAGTQRTTVVTPASVAPGGAFTVSGPADCILDSTLTITVVGLNLTQDVSGDAAWSLDFIAPADAAPGTYAVTVDNAECGYVDSSLVITAVTPTTAAPTPTTAEPVVAAAAAAAPAFTG